MLYNHSFCLKYIISLLCGFLIDLRFGTAPAYSCLYGDRGGIMAKAALHGKHPGNKTMPFFFFFNQVLYEKQLCSVLF